MKVTEEMHISKDKMGMEPNIQQAVQEGQSYNQERPMHEVLQ